MKRLHQRGWITSFVVIGLVLLLVLLGGVYLLKNHQTEVAKNDTTKSSVDTPDDKSSSTAKDAKNDQKTNDTDKSSEGTNVIPVPGDATIRTQEDANSKQSIQSSVPSSSATTTIDSASQLPQTGPREGLTTVAVLALLTFVFGTYLKSRSSQA